MTLVQPIAGVPADRETELETIYPSVAAQPLGRWIGRVMELPSGIQSTSLRIFCQSLFGLFLLPLAIVAYSLSKLTGQCHVITTHRIVTQSLIGKRSLSEVPVLNIASIKVENQAGDRFLHVGDLILNSSAGETLMRLSAVPYPERVKELIQKLQTVRNQTAAAQAQIQARKSLTTKSQSA